MSRRSSFILCLLLLSILLALSNAMAAERFVDNGDGTVTDHELKLMWSKTDNLGDIDWHQALKWVKYTFPLTLQESYDNWRLPTLAELESLVDKDSGYETDCHHRVFINPLIRLSCGWIWTSETGAIAPTSRIFNFANIYHYTVRKAHHRGYRALAVRSLK